NCGAKGVTSSSSCSARRWQRDRQTNKRQEKKKLSHCHRNRWRFPRLTSGMVALCRRISSARCDCRLSLLPCRNVWETFRSGGERNDSWKRWRQYTWRPRRTRWMYLSGAATVRRQISRQSDADEVSNRLQPIERAANAKPAAIENVQIDHRRV